MNNKNKFSGLANHYDASRPSYAVELIECLFEKYQLSVDSIVADIGAGTGKFAKQLLDRGCTVICVEPNADMRTMAEQSLCDYSNVTIIDGSDSNTNVVNHSVDFVSVAQAFHWFDADSFQRECQRILKPHGKVILVWNMRDMNAAVNQANYEVFKKYCPNFYGFSGGVKTEEAHILNFFEGAVEIEKFLNPLTFTKDKFIQRCLSASYSLRPEDEHYEAYVQELEQLFDDFADNGQLTVANNTKAYIGSV